MSPVAVAPSGAVRDVFQTLTAVDLDESSEEAKVVMSAVQKVRKQVLDERISLVFDLLGSGLTLAGKVYWLEEPNPFLDDRRPLDVLWAGRFEQVWAAAESYLVGDFV